MRESKIEAYLVRRAKEVGADTRKLKFVAHDGAPDRVLMVPRHIERFGRFSTCPTIWVEVKATGGAATFPADARERAQAREHKRMRDLAQMVVVVDSFEGVEELLR